MGTFPLRGASWFSIREIVGEVASNGRPKVRHTHAHTRRRAAVLMDKSLARRMSLLTQHKRF